MSEKHLVIDGKVHEAVKKKAIEKGYKLRDFASKILKQHLEKIEDEEEQ